MQVKTVYSLLVMTTMATIGFFSVQGAEMSNEDRDLKLALALSVVTYDTQVRKASPESQLERVLAESKKEAELKEAHRKEMEELNFQIAIAQSQEDEQLRKYKEAAGTKPRARTAPAAPKKEEEQSECSICLEPPKKPFKLSCKHIFCRDCIAAHLADAIRYNKDAFCPLCRTKINEQNRKNATM